MTSIGPRLFTYKVIIEERNFVSGSEGFSEPKQREGLKSWRISQVGLLIALSIRSRRNPVKLILLSVRGDSHDKHFHSNLFSI